MPVGIFDKFKRRPNATDDQRAAAAAEPEPAPVAVPPPAEAPSDAAQQVADLREQVELWVRPGFLSRADVLEYARDFRDDDEVPLDDEQLTLLVEDVWQARLAEQVRGRRTRMPIGWRRRLLSWRRTVWWPG